jgi:ethylbenzene dioxygenase beta subunit
MIEVTVLKPPHSRPRLSADLVSEIEQFLYREARLLDNEDYDEWLRLLTDDVHYWMPVIENRFRGDPAGAYGPERMAYFDDTLEDLRRRVVRFKSPAAWMENPCTRHVHVITNVEVELTGRADEYKVHSLFVNYRNRGEADEDTMFGRREDTLCRIEGELYLARRLVLLAQSMLLSKNINTLL